MEELDTPSTLNSANFWDMFVKTNYTRTFAKIMRPKGFDKEPHPDEIDEKEDFKLWTNKKMGIEYPSSIGPSYGLQVCLPIKFTLICSYLYTTQTLP